MDVQPQVDEVPREVWVLDLGLLGLVAVQLQEGEVHLGDEAHEAHEAHGHHVVDADPGVVVDLHVDQVGSHHQVGLSQVSVQMAALAHVVGAPYWLAVPSV